MEILQYEIIDKKLDRLKPYYDKKKSLLIFRIQGAYNYYCQARKYNPETNDYEYFLLLGKTRFNDNCNIFYRDDFGRYKIRATDKLRIYMESITIDNANFELDCVDSNEYYDVWQIN